MRHATAHVAPLYGATANLLIAGASAAVADGFHGLKIYATPNYAGQRNPSRPDYANQAYATTAYNNIAELVADPVYNTVFSMPQLSTFYISTWTFFDGADNYYEYNVSAAKLEQEYTELKNATTYLLNTYSNKRFIWQNWEGDWQLLNTFNTDADIPSSRIGRYSAYLRARVEGVRDGMRAVSGSSSMAAYAVEVNRALDDWSDRVHKAVLPSVQPPVVSMSIYEAINGWQAGLSQADAEASIAWLMPKLVERVRRYAPNATFQVGEYGFPENRSDFVPSGLNAGLLVQKVVDTAQALGFTDCVFWNYWDNEQQSPGVPVGFYIRKPDGSLSSQGDRYVNHIL